MKTSSIFLSTMVGITVLASCSKNTPASIALATVATVLVLSSAITIIVRAISKRFP